MCLIDHSGFYEQMSERIVEAFYAQDLDAIKIAMDEKMHNSCDSSPEEENMLIYNRRKNAGNHGCKAYAFRRWRRPFTRRQRCFKSVAYGGLHR